MGGKKKISLRQMEQKQRSGKGKKTGEKKEPRKRIGEMDRSGIVLPNLKDKNIIEEVKKIGVLTPYTVASHFNVRMSVARDLLKQLEGRRVVQMVRGNHKLRIYKPVD